jgi:hypothetical protein
MTKMTQRYKEAGATIVESPQARSAASERVGFARYPDKMELYR